MDFEKCLFMAVNFHEEFIALSSLFANKEDFHMKYIKF